MIKKPLTDKNGEVRELTREDFAGMRRLGDAHPEIAEAFGALRRGRPPVDAPKKQITLRLDAALVAAIKAKGRGYMARVESVLSDALKRGVL